MAFYQPIHRRQEIDPQLLIIIAAIFLILISFFVAAAIQTPHEERIAPDSAIAGTVSQAGTVTGPAPHMLTATIHATSLETALTDLLKGQTPAAQKAGVYSEIPKGTQLLGVTVKNSIVTINLSREFTTGGGATSVIERVAELKRTVRGINCHYRMKLAIEGKPLTVLTGEGLELDEAI